MTTRSPRVGSLGLLVAAGLLACSGEQTCPPGIEFDDCTPSTEPIRAPSQPAASTNEDDGPPAMAEDPSPPEENDPDPPETIDESGEGQQAEDTPLVNIDENDAQGGDTDPPDPSVDECPDDFAKIAPGACGCGTPDEDFDADGTADCNEECPDNADRTEPDGACGCSSLASAAACNQLRDAIRNLYTFDGSGVNVVDSAGGMDGTILDATGAASAQALGALQVNGRLNLDGFGSYVNLPSGMVSNLTNATFEVWVAWEVGAAWARIFDFGANNGAAPSQGTSYLFLTPLNSLTSTARVAYSLDGPGAAETLVDAPIALTQGGNVVDHVVVVVNDANNVMELYINGNLSSSVAFNGQLSAINDANNWLGRSNYSVDPALYARLVEFRIYDLALSGAQVSTSFQAGPGALK